jgi:hypothetical protein
LIAIYVILKSAAILVSNLKGKRLRLFEDRALWGIFGPMAEEVARGWTRLHNEEVQNLYGSLNVIRLIKLRRMKWAGHVARLKETRNT